MRFSALCPHERGLGGSTQMSEQYMTISLTGHHAWPLNGGLISLAQMPPSECIFEPLKVRGVGTRGTYSDANSHHIIEVSNRFCSIPFHARVFSFPSKCTQSAGVQSIQPDEGAILEVAQWGSLLVFSTQQGTIHGWDPRSSKNAWTLTAKPSSVSA